MCTTGVPGAGGPGCGARPLCVPVRGSPLGRAALRARGRRPAREIATREPDGSEWSISRPALALPPPTGTATMPHHHPRAPQPGPPAPPAPPHQLPNGTKLAPHGFIIAKTVQNSPCRRKIDQNRAFPRCRANFVTAMPSETSCWASFIPKVGAGISVGRFSSHDRPRTPIAGQGAPHINQDTQ